MIGSFPPDTIRSRIEIPLAGALMADTGHFMSVYIGCGITGMLFRLICRSGFLLDKHEYKSYYSGDEVGGKHPVKAATVAVERRWYILEYATEYKHYAVEKRT